MARGIIAISGDLLAATGGNPPYGILLIWRGERKREARPGDPLHEVRKDGNNGSPWPTHRRASPLLDPELPRDLAPF